MSVKIMTQSGEVVGSGVLLLASDTKEVVVSVGEFSVTLVFYNAQKGESAPEQVRDDNSARLPITRGASVYAGMGIGSNHAIHVIVDQVTGFHGGYNAMYTMYKNQ